MKKTPGDKILFWDIETAPMVATTWTLFKPRLSHDNIIQGSTLLTIAWRWSGTSTTEALSIDPGDPRDDFHLVDGFHDVISKAKLLVGHNADRFDLRHFNAACLRHGLAPIPKIPSVDTLKVAKKHFWLDSYRLDFLGKLLLKEGKIHTDYDLWLRILDGDAAALKEMVKYNKKDVELLEKVYLCLRPFIQNHPRVGCVDDCPNCGSASIQRRGKQRNRRTFSQRFQCQFCGAWFSGPVKKG